MQNWLLSAISQLPELRALDSRRQLVRIPHECDVPLTDRVRAIVDTPEFRRLSQISQLGLVVAGLSGGQSHAVRAFAGRVSHGAVVS